MGEAVIIDAIRTPIGRYAGALKDVRPDDLAALVMRALLDRHPELEPGQIDDVIFGCINQAGEDNRNVARMGLLLAGLPVTVTGVTVNRLCGSGLEAVNQSAYAISSSCRGVTDGIRTRPLRSNHDTRNRHQACVPNHADRRAAGADLDDADARRLDGRCVPHQPRCRRQVERLFDNPVRHRRLAAGESDFHAVLRRRRRRRGDHAEARKPDDDCACHDSISTAVFEARPSHPGSCC